MIARPERSVMQALAVNAAILPSFIDFGRETCCLATRVYRRDESQADLI